MSDTGTRKYVPVPLLFSMTPISKSDSNKKNRPAGFSDFDLPYAYLDLNSESIGSERSVWKTAIWANFLTGGVSVGIGVVICALYRYDPFSQQIPLVAKIIIGIVVLLLCCFSVLLGILSLTRGRLVLDKKLRELKFYRFWFSFIPHRRVSIDSIEALFHRTISSPGDSSEPGRDYDILVAKLKDNRLASIAINSQPSVESELKLAIGLDTNNRE